MSLLLLQGDFFLTGAPPPKFPEYKSLYNLWHLEKFWVSFDGILYLKKYRGAPVKKSPCITIWVLSQLYLLRFVIIWALSFVPIWVFKFCHNLGFWVLSQFEFEFCQNLSLWVLSQFEFLSFVTIWSFKFCQYLSFWLLSQFGFLSIVTIWVLDFCHNLSFRLLSHFEFLTFFKLFEFLTFVSIWVFEFLVTQF